MLRYYISLLCFCFFVAFSGGQYVYAQDVSVKIAVLDVQKIMKSSKAGLSIKTQVESKRNSFLKTLEKKEKSLREDEKALVDKKNTLPKEEFLKQRKVFEGKFLDTQKFAKKSNRSLEEAYAKAMAQLQDDVFSIVEKMAEKNAYTLVLRRHDVFLAAKATDITDEVLKALNAKTKKIPLEVKE